MDTNGDWVSPNFVDRLVKSLNFPRFGGHSAYFCHLLFIRCWADISVVLMASRPIIKHLNIIEDFCSRHFTGFKDVATDFLLLQTPEERLDRRIIITVPSATFSIGPNSD